jgi:hypothetical protein
MSDENELVNATQCAKILTEQMDRPVKRSYISKLAADGRIPFHTIDSKKMFSVDEVMNSLPAERSTSAKYEQKEYIQEVKEVANAPTKKDIINHFKALGFRFAEHDKIDLLNIELPTVKDVKKELSVLELSAKQKELITDEYLEKSIIELSPSLIELKEIWENFMSLNFEKEYVETFDTLVDSFSQSQISFIRYILLSSFINAEQLAEYIEDEIYCKLH